MSTLEDLKILKNRKKFRIYKNKLVVYKIQNVLNKKCYIGVTSRILRRIVEHIKFSENFGKLTSYIHRAIRKYGLNNFTFEVIDFADNNKELCQKEEYFIKQCDSNNTKSGYNLTSGGLRGIPNDITVLKKIASSHKIKVAKYDINGNFICSYESVMEASRQNKISDTDIHRCSKKNWTRNGCMYKKFKDKPLLYIKPFKSKKGINLVNGDGFQGKNKIQCRLINKKTNSIEFKGNSLEELSNKSGLHTTTLHRIFKNKEHKKWKLIKIK